MNAVPPGTRFSAFGGGDLVWIEVVGPGICRESGRFEAVLEQVERGGFPNLVIDLAQCPRMDSTFAGALLRLAQRTTSARRSGLGRRVILNRATDQVRELVDTLCLEPLLELADIPPPVSLSGLEIEPGDRHREDIMALSLDGHERLAALNEENARRFAGVLTALREQCGSQPEAAPPGCADADERPV